MRHNRLEVDKDIQKQKQRKEMVELYGGLPKGHGSIEIAGVTLEPQDVAKLSSILEGDYKVKPEGEV